MKDERWDIYNINKEPTGRTMRRNDWNMQPGDYHLTVLGVIRRPDSRFLITQRVMTKSWAPGCWEVSGGGVMAGETSEEAVRREVLEETGIDVCNPEYSACGFMAQFPEDAYQFTYRRDNPEERDNYFVDVYRFDLDVDESDVTIQTEEAAAFMFATADEIEELGRSGRFLHYDSIKAVFLEEAGADC